MEIEKMDLLARKRKQRGQLLKFISNYMQSHLMRSCDLSELSVQAKDEMACEIVNLFEDRFLQLRRDAPSKKGALAGSSGEAQVDLRRRQCRD
ncbi:hypothetical protein [Parasedimentitalea psychrophila]|uniref:Uncharacterized protein n=1 Tax=Parasedimentitalea psychrophila TaxID=2997337 RepID=A0A9Y2L306_9RHOB|nr:hypothetical protein [Parasedimentitalea psychrophila]WIY27388.1 hypothetical protein QPJ95_11005 [Parasedimentitalea psychrophila]